jgi:Pup amidohydrolase
MTHRLMGLETEFCLWDWNINIPAPLLRVAECALLMVVRPLALPFLFLLRATAFREIRSGALAFFISRPVVTGAGTLNNDGTFGLSERATSIAESIRSTPLQRRRAVFDVANFLKPLFLSAGSLVAPVTALFSRRQRLQLGISDSNCAQTAEFLKIGTTALVIDMAEAGFLLDAPSVRRPVSALKRISGDSTLQARVRLRRGRAMTAVQIQRWYLQRAEAFLAAKRVASPESHGIVRPVADDARCTRTRSVEPGGANRLGDEAGVAPGSSCARSWRQEEN